MERRCCCATDAIVVRLVFQCSVEKYLTGDRIPHLVPQPSTSGDSEGAVVLLPLPLSHTQSRDDTVEMEDGADVHSTTHGSLVADGPLESQQHSRCVRVPPQFHQI